MPYSMQLTEQSPNDPPRMGAKSITTSNYPSTPGNPEIATDYSSGAYHAIT